MDPTSAPIVPGYRLSAVLGRGATSTVWAGERVRDGAPVAVKVVGSTGDGAEAVARELSVLGSVADPHLVRVEEVLAGPGVVHVVMERLDGGTLGGLVRARGALSAGEVVTVLAPVAAAVGALHRLGLVHGDLAPGNVFLDGSGRPVIGDFGLAGVVGAMREEVWGTAGFVAPEVLMGAAPDRRTDVYSVGALGWYAASGEPPVTGCDLRREIDALGLPPSLALVLLDLLAPDPDDRPTASDAALRIFDAFPAEPLALTDTGGDLSLLTRRLRLDAASPADVADSSRTSDSPRSGRRARAARRWPVPRGARGRAALTGIGLIVAVALGLTAVGLGWRAPRSADAATRQPGAVQGLPLPSAAASASATPRAPSTATSTQVRPTSTKPDLTDPRGIVQSLADTRARILRTSPPATADLDTLDVLGSPAFATDAALLDTVRAAKTRYVDLAFTVRSAAVVASSGQTATLRAVIDTGPYAVSKGAQVEQHAARPGIPVLLDLHWTADGWRIHQIRALEPPVGGGAGESGG